VLPDLAGSVPIEVDAKNFHCTIRDDENGNTSIDASWTERSGAPGKLSALIEMPAGHETLNVVIPWSDSLYQFASKHQARPAHGTLQVGGKWTVGTGATENGVFVDARLSKIGRVRDAEGQIDATLVPRFDTYGLIEAKFRKFF